MPILYYTYHPVYRNLRVFLNEHWKPIKKLGGVYKVSNKGQVKSITRKVPHPRLKQQTIHGKILKQANTGGYKQVAFNDSFGLVHRLVLEAFVGPCPEGMECRHLNGDRSDNRLENLCWGTPKQQAEDRMKHGTTTLGYHHGPGNSWKLKDRIDEMIALWETGEYNKSQLARMFGVKTGTICYHLNKRYRGYDD